MQSKYTWGVSQRTKSGRGSSFAKDLGTKSLVRALLQGSSGGGSFLEEAAAILRPSYERPIASSELLP